MPEIFISYSRHDTPFVRRLHDALVESKRDAWVDWEDIPASAEWLKEIFGAIDGVDTFLFIVSPESVASKMCLREVQHAAENGKRIVTILHRDVDTRTLTSPLADIQWLLFRDADDFDAALRALIQTLDTDLNWVRAHTRLLVRAREWEGNGRDRSFLLRGKDLAEAEHWMGSVQPKEPKPTTLQSQYVITSRQAATRTQTRIIAGVSVALLIAIGLAIVAEWQRQVAVKQNSIAARANWLRPR